MRLLKTILGIGIISGAIFFAFVLYTFFVQQPRLGVTPVVFHIEPGQGVKKISTNLKKQGVVDNKFLFEFYVWLFKKDKSFQPGEFYLKSDSSLHSIVKDLTTAHVKEKRLTIIEGWNLRDLASYLLKEGVIKDEEELYELTGRPAVDYRNEKIDFQNSWDYKFLKGKPEYVNFEGYFYPDTYKILAEDNVDVLLTKALDNFDKKLTSELRNEISRQGKTIFDVLRVASIVEKEVFTYEDRQIVADIIWRRLARNQALQMDSTINYITDSGRSRSTLTDLEINSPYNTYKYAGFPHGPISNPSIWAIQATVYPKPNSYWYFLSDPEQNVYYASTYEGHLENRKYLD